ncbi:MAG: type II toxin-antitoxin system RelB/DinJ family antitoxin [Oscillospiraceae bacterium]|nr:type II toxin-antitoxin system RelB/DinJ family antitoxin [Oscillospiraceae bacterium]
MPATTINVRVDEDVKKDVEELFGNLGLNLSTAVNIFFRQSLMEEAIPFQIKFKRRHKTLKERLKGVNGGYDFEEWDTGESVGGEVVE